MNDEMLETLKNMKTLKLPIKGFEEKTTGETVLICTITSVVLVGLFIPNVDPTLCWVLVCGFILWGMILAILSIQNARRVAKDAMIAMHAAEVNKLHVYIKSIQANINKDVWQSAVDKAEKSDDYIFAKIISTRKMLDHGIAERVAKGEY